VPVGICTFKFGVAFDQTLRPKHGQNNGVEKDQVWLIWRFRMLTVTVSWITSDAQDFERGHQKELSSLKSHRQDPKDEPKMNQRWAKDEPKRY